MSGRRLAACFGLAFIVSLLLLLPLQVVLPRLAPPAALSATAVEGSLWSGRLRAARWRGVELGGLRAGLSPLPLLAGRRQLWLRSTGAALTLHAGRIRGIDDANGVLPLPAPAGLGLRASLEDTALLFAAGACHRAGGRVRIELTLPGDARPPLVLAGTPACEGRTATLLLQPEASAPLRLDVRMDIDGEGGWRVQSLADSDDPGLRLALRAAGFQDAPGGLSRVDTGRPGG